MIWLNIIRPDWFDVNYEMRSQVQTYFILKNLLETRECHLSNEKFIKLVLENAEFESYRSVLIHLIMQHEQWEWIQFLVKHEHDWSFLHTQSNRVTYLVEKIECFDFLTVVT